MNEVFRVERNYDVVVYDDDGDVDDGPTITLTTPTNSHNEIAIFNLMELHSIKMPTKQLPLFEQIFG